MGRNRVIGDAAEQLAYFRQGLVGSTSPMTISMAFPGAYQLRWNDCSISPVVASNEAFVPSGS